MSRITLQTVATAQDAAKPRLQAALDANGFLPNLLAVLAIRHRSLGRKRRGGVGS